MGTERRGEIGRTVLAGQIEQPGRCAAELRRGDTRQVAGTALGGCHVSKSCFACGFGRAIADRQHRQAKELAQARVPRYRARRIGACHQQPRPGTLAEVRIRDRREAQQRSDQRIMPEGAQSGGRAQRIGLGARDQQAQCRHS